MAETLAPATPDESMYDIGSFALHEEVVVPDTVAELLAEQPSELTDVTIGMSSGASEDYDR